MTSKIIHESINEAKKWLDLKDSPEHDPIVVFNMVEGILSNVKSFIHDETVWKKIEDFEINVHKDFKLRLDESRQKLKQEDPFFAWQDGMKYYVDLRTWKCQELLSFYDDLSKSYDI